MLDKMRTHSRNWLIYLMFGAIILVFSINFGPGFDQMSQTGCSRGSVTAATVNGQGISRRLFLMQWRNYVQLRRLNPKLQDTFNKNRVLDQLVQLYLLAQEAVKYGVRVPDSEVEDTIINDPSFQRDGIFDQQAYKSVTSFYRLTPKEYANFIRISLQAEKFRKLLNNGMLISDAEVKQAFWAKNDKVAIRYVMFDSARLERPVVVSSEEADAFAKKNPARLKKYYDSHLNQFVQEKQVRARHILIKVPPKAPAAKVTAARKKITELLKKAKKDPKSFAALAKKHSEGPSKIKGGDLGFFTKARMVPPFSKAAFALKKPNDISDVVKSKFGFHIIQLVAIKPGKSETLKDQSVKRRIAQALLQKDKTKAAVKKAAERLLGHLKKGKSFKKALALVKQETAVTLKPATRKASTRPALRKGAAATRPAVAKQATPRKAIRKVWLRGLKVKTTPQFPRASNMIPGLKDGKQTIQGEQIYPLIKAAFSLSKKQPLPNKPVVSGDKVYVIQFKKRTSPKSLQKRFEKEKAAQRESLKTVRQLQFLKMWIDRIKKDAKVSKSQAILKARYQL